MGSYKAKEEAMSWQWWVLQMGLPIAFLVAVVGMEVLHRVGVYP